MLFQCFLKANTGNRATGFKTGLQRLKNLRAPIGRTCRIRWDGIVARNYVTFTGLLFARWVLVAFMNSRSFLVGIILRLFGKSRFLGGGRHWHGVIVPWF